MVDQMVRGLLIFAQANRWGWIPAQRRSSRRPVALLCRSGGDGVAIVRLEARSAP